MDLEDAAVIWRDENGKVHVTTPAHHAVAKGTVSGLSWGTLTGLLFMFPLVPLAGVAGGIMGAALDAAWRLGIEDDFGQRVQDLVQPGTPALMVIVRKTTRRSSPRRCGLKGSPAGSRTAGGGRAGAPWLMRGHARRHDGASHVPWR